MAEKQSRKLFVNLAVRDLKRSMDFFAQLGFAFNPKFTDDNAACMIVSDDAYAMLLTEPFFRTFTRRELRDTSRSTEGLLALSCDGRAAAALGVSNAGAAGGQRARGP